MTQQVVVITGCDSGFGNQAAITFGEKGWTVLAGCFTEAGIKAFADNKDGCNKNKNVTGVQLDVTDDESVNKFAAKVKEVCGDKGLNGLINNAGVAPTGYVEWAEIGEVGTKDRWTLRAAMEINVFGQIRLTKALCPLIRKAQGRVTNVSSLLGRMAFGGAPWYSCTKHAVEGWTDSFRREMRPFGVTVHLIEPGFFQTPMVGTEQYNNELDRQWKKLTPELKEAYTEATLTGYKENVKDQIDKMAIKDTSPVIDAMLHSMESRWAKARYPCGWNARFFFLPISHMPVWLADNITDILNPKYPPTPKPASMVGRRMRLDIVAVWLLVLPCLAKAFGSLGWSSPKLYAFIAAWCLSWKMS